MGSLYASVSFNPRDEYLYEKNDFHIIETVDCIPLSETLIIEYTVGASETIILSGATVSADVSSKFIFKKNGQIFLPPITLNWTERTFFIPLSGLKLEGSDLLQIFGYNSHTITSPFSVSVYGKFL